MKYEGLLKQASIVIVDDTAENLRVLTGMLQMQGYEVRPVLSGKQALQAVRSQPPDLILMDINMPEMNGYEVCTEIKKEELLKNIPIIFISALSETLDKVKAFSVGGVDYVTKPFQIEEVNARVETHLKLRALMTNLEDLVEQKIKEISASQMTTIMAMARLTQSRDDSTGTHLERVGAYCRLIAEELMKLPEYKNKIDSHYVDLICSASALHDIGKIGVPDSILLKPAKLTVEEFEIMKTHTSIGAETLEDVNKYYPQNEFVKVGIQMTRWHHEKWDGTGYPDGLIQEQIPLSAQIMSLADVYDALKSERLYKKAFSNEECYRIILEESKGVFNPIIVDAFKRIQGEMSHRWAEFHTPIEIVQ